MPGSVAGCVFQGEGHGHFQGFLQRVAVLCHGLHCWVLEGTCRYERYAKAAHRSGEYSPLR